MAERLTAEQLESEANGFEDCAHAEPGKACMSCRFAAMVCHQLIESKRDLAAALAREQGLREALEKIIAMTFEAAVDDNRPVSGYRIRQLADAALQPPDAPTEPCANGHTWSNHFGDDWSPDNGTRCDCGKKAWNSNSAQLSAQDAPTEE